MDHQLIDAVMDRMASGPRPDPVARLGRAAMLLSRELADCRREIAELRRENTELRRKLVSHPADWAR
jgi:hypothetical protein